MGVVFKARHTFLKTAHAIKIILPDLVGNDPMLATRFRQEALAAAAIKHQNIIAVTDFGMIRGTMPFLVMEFVKGRSLQEILTEEGKMKPERAYELIHAGVIPSIRIGSSIRVPVAALKAWIDQELAASAERTQQR